DLRAFAASVQDRMPATDWQLPLRRSLIDRGHPAVLWWASRLVRRVVQATGKIFRSDDCIAHPTRCAKSVQDGLFLGPKPILELKNAASGLRSTNCRNYRAAYAQLPRLASCRRSGFALRRGGQSGSAVLRLNTIPSKLRLPVMKPLLMRRAF